VKDKYFYNILQSEFENKETFTRIELKNLFFRFEPDLKDSTFTWRIYYLKTKGIITELKRGLYTLKTYCKYKPEIKDILVKINKVIKKNSNNLEYCLWETDWLNDFSLHLHAKSFIILEIEKDFMEYLFFKLKDLGFEVFLRPDKEVLRLYVSEIVNPIVIKPLLKNSPLYTLTNINIPNLEKIMVDIFCDKEIFYMFDRSELIFVYGEILKRYQINYTRLANYAKYRGSLTEIKNIVLNIPDDNFNIKNLL